MINNKKVIGLTLAILALFGGVFVYARGGMMNNSNMYGQNHMNGNYSNTGHMNDRNHMNRNNTNNMMMNPANTSNKINTDVKSTEKVENVPVPYGYNEEYFNSDAYRKEVEAYQKEMEAYRKDANEFRNKMLEEDYKNGRITKSERDLWVDYYKTMDKYQNSGYGMGRGMGYGGCHGGGGMMRGGHHGMMGNGMMGPGMMRGYSY